MSRFRSRSRCRSCLRVSSSAAPWAALLAICAALVASPAPAAHAAPVAPASAATAARLATAYLLKAQNDDGGLGPAAGQPSDELFAGWAALGLASAGVDVARRSHGGRSLLAYVERGAVGDTGDLERTILAVHAAGVSPRAVGGRDLVTRLLARVRRNGSIGGQVNLTAFGLLALRAAGVNPPRVSLGWLIAQQDRDGGFGFASGGGSSDPDDTGAVLEALAGDATGPAARARSRAVAYLRSVQDRDGGFSAGLGGGSNAQSTAWAQQGLLAAGVDPARVHRPRGETPLHYLVALTGPRGSVSYSRGLVQTPVWVTAEVLMALESRPLPIAPPRPVSPPVSPQRTGTVGSAAATVTADDLAALAEAAGTLTGAVLAPIGI